jgi:hypothetical protein
MKRRKSLMERSGTNTGKRSRIVIMLRFNFELLK